MKIDDLIENVNGTKQSILFVLRPWLYVIRDEASKEVYIEEIEVNNKKGYKVEEEPEEPEKTKE